MEMSFELWRRAGKWNENFNGKFRRCWSINFAIFVIESSGFMDEKIRVD